MGWNSPTAGAKDKGAEEGGGAARAVVDSMDAANYYTVKLRKPMGMVLIENDNSEQGDVGVFVKEVEQGGESDGKVSVNDQIISLKVDPSSSSLSMYGKKFEDVVDAMKDATEVEVTLFRGPWEEIYGKGRPSKGWLNGFVEGL